MLALLCLSPLECISFASNGCQEDAHNFSRHCSSGNGAHFSTDFPLKFAVKSKGAIFHDAPPLCNKAYFSIDFTSNGCQEAEHNFLQKNNRKRKLAVGKKRGRFGGLTIHISVTVSISTSTFLGRVLTATHERAGLETKCFS